MLPRMSYVSRPICKAARSCRRGANCIAQTVTRQAKVNQGEVQAYSSALAIGHVYTLLQPIPSLDVLILRQRRAADDRVTQYEADRIPNGLSPQSTQLSP